MPRVIMPIPSTDFDPTETSIPWHILSSKGIEVIFATPDGRVGACDPRMMDGDGLGIFREMLRADETARQAYEVMVQSHSFQQPARWDGIKLVDFDAILLPGGHSKGMIPYLESEVLQSLVASFFKEGKRVAAVCHGVVLAARSRSKEGTSILRGRRVTALLKTQELAAWAMTYRRLGNYYRTYPQTVQDEVTQAVGAEGQFLRGPFPLLRDRETHLQRGFVVEDRHLITARWPGDCHVFANTLVQRLKA